MELRVLGRSLLVEVRSELLARSLWEDWAFPEHDLPPVPYTIRVQEVEAPPQIPAGEVVSVALHRMRLDARVGDGSWSFGGRSAGVQLHLVDGEARVSVWGVQRTREARGSTLAALRLCLVESLRASGLLPLHVAAAVREGGATVFAGRSGVGKSTTLWRAMTAGWAPLCEDFAWLEARTRRLYGWDRGIRLRPDARATFAAAFPDHVFDSDSAGKLMVPYARLTTPVERSSPLRRLVLLQREEKALELSDAAGAGLPCVLLPLPTGDAVRAWWEATGVPLAPGTRASVAAQVAALVRGVEAVRLRLDGCQLALEAAGLSDGPHGVGALGV